MWECQCNACRNGGYYEPPVSDPDDAVEADQWWQENMGRRFVPQPDYASMNDEIPF